VWYKPGMKDQEHWKNLCAQAAVEQDPEKLMELVEEINRLLKEKEARLKDPPKPEGA
jgi:7,8-dihydro-6-hydroxymethylpterin-pyrophosphokinase